MTAVLWRSSDSILVGVVIFLLALSGFFALAETALVRMTRSRAIALQNEKRRGAHALLSLVEHPDEFLNPLLLLILICQLVSATLVGVLASHLFGPAGVAIATAFEVIVIFVLFEAIPKNFAIQHGASSALAAAPLVSVLMKFWPVRIVSAVLLALARWALKPFGRSENPGDQVESEIRAMATAAALDKHIDETEADVITGVFELDETMVREVMIPRVDMVCVDSTVSAADALAHAIETNRSRLPVLGDDIDDVVGVVTLRQLARAVQDGRGADRLTDLGIVPAHFVPETKKLGQLLQEFRSLKTHLFIVADEYGGTAGIVTLEDVLEEMVGDIEDEHDYSSTQKLSDKEKKSVWPKLISGRMNLDDANEEFGLSLPEGSWDTVGGAVLDYFGGIPQVGDVVDMDPYHVEVLEVDGRRVESVRVTLQ
jgi:CBS domain containing-hemolysin-like protein